MGEVEMMNIYVGDSIFSIPLGRWSQFRQFLLNGVKNDDIRQLKYVYSMMYGYILSVDVLDDAISQLGYFMKQYPKFNDILEPLQQLLVNAKRGNKEVGFGVI